MRKGSVCTTLAVLAAAIAWLVPAGTRASAAGPIVIGVDHADPANQQAKDGRLFEYRDFFSRAVSVHQGDTIDFRTAPNGFHVVALSADEKAARAAYPVVLADADDAPTPDHHPKLQLGPGNNPVIGGSTSGGGFVDYTNGQGPPDCGSSGRPSCVFTGGNDVEIAGATTGTDANGNPAPQDWNVTIDAPPGTYHYFCMIHPKMSGTLSVVASSAPVTTQSAVDRASARQFRADRAEALAAERAANHVRFSVAHTHRTYDVTVGVATKDRRVGIDEMFPRSVLKLAAGDGVRYTWADPDNIHVVFFPDVENDVPPIGFDCGTSYDPITGFPPVPCVEPGEAPETIGDPGNAGSGAVLRAPHSIVDSGVLAGSGLLPSGPHQWSTSTKPAVTQPGTYTFKCTVHDFMTGTLEIR
jgi:plastocyanin